MRKLIFAFMVVAIAVLFASGCIGQPKAEERSPLPWNNRIVGNESFVASDAPIAIDWIDLFGQNSMFFFTNRDLVAHRTIVMIKKKSGLTGYSFELPAGKSNVLLASAFMGTERLEITVAAENIEVQKIAFNFTPGGLSYESSRYGIDRNCQALSCRWAGYWHENGLWTSLIKVKEINASEISLVKRPSDNVAAIKEINDTLYTLGAKNVNIKSVYAQPVMNYYVGATVTRGAVKIEANFFLPGNVAKKEIITEELGQIKEFVDICVKNGYRNLSLRMEPLTVLSWQAQERQWMGSGWLPLGSGLATVSLTQNSSMVSSTTTSPAKEDVYTSNAYIEKKNALGRHLVLNTNIKGVQLMPGQKIGLQWVNCGPCMYCYAEGNPCNYRYEVLWAVAKCQGVMTEKQLAAAQKAIEEERDWTLTFVNNTVI